MGSTGAFLVRGPMRVRDMKYSDYGITEERRKALLNYCRSNPDIELLTTAAMYANLELHELLIKNLKEGIGWNGLSYLCYIPIGEVDFYGYRRKALANLDALLIGEDIQI